MKGAYPVVTLSNTAPWGHRPFSLLRLLWEIFKRRSQGFGHLDSYDSCANALFMTNMENAYENTHYILQGNAHNCVSYF